MLKALLSASLLSLCTMTFAMNNVTVEYTKLLNPSQCPKKIVNYFNAGHTLQLTFDMSNAPKQPLDNGDATLISHSTKRFSVDHDSKLNNEGMRTKIGLMTDEIQSTIVNHTSYPLNRVYLLGNYGQFTSGMLIDKCQIVGFQISNP